MTDKNVQKNSMTEDNVTELLGGLRRVETPNDFGVKVRARIAERRDANRSFSLSGLFKIATPAAALVLLAAFLYFGGIFSNNIPETDGLAVVEQPANNSMQIAQTTDDNASINTELEVAAANTNQTSNLQVVEVSNQNTNKTVVRPNKNVENLRPRTITETPLAGSSTTRAATAQPQTIRPPGLTPQNVPEIENRPEGFEASGSFTANELIGLFGAEGDVTTSGLKVSSVTANGIAERSGIKKGDLITSIDGQQITPSSRFDGGKTYKTANIIRDGQNIEVEISINKP